MAGKPTEGKFLRLTLEHIAVNWDEKNAKDMENSKRFLDFIGGVLRERFEARGWRFVSFLSVYFAIGVMPEWESDVPFANGCQ